MEGPSVSKWPTAEVSRTGAIDPNRNYELPESRHRDQGKRTYSVAGRWYWLPLHKMLLVIVGAEAGTSCSLLRESLEVSTAHCAEHLRQVVQPDIDGSDPAGVASGSGTVTTNSSEHMNKPTQMASNRP